MLLKKLAIFFIALVTVVAFGMIQGCSESEKGVEPIEDMLDIPDYSGVPDPSMGKYFDTTFIDEAEFLATPPIAAKIGAKMTVAWPFSSLQRMSDWTGWTGSRTSGMSGSFCGGTRPSTHSGAEHNARDLNQKRGLDYGIWTFAGFAGKVVYAGWQKGYGNTVVVWDPVRRVAIRYAHLSYIYHSGVKVGRYIPRHRFIGKTGNTGTSTGTHLHIVGYENLNSTPTIPNLCDSDHFACQINFYWWRY